MDLFLIGQWLAILIAGENNSVDNQRIWVWTCMLFGGSKFLFSASDLNTWLDTSDLGTCAEAILHCLNVILKSNIIIHLCE